MFLQGASLGGGDVRRAGGVVGGCGDGEEQLGDLFDLGVYEIFFFFGGGVCADGGFEGGEGRD